MNHENIFDAHFFSICLAKTHKKGNDVLIYSTETKFSHAHMQIEHPLSLLVLTKIVIE